jgi:hypothetical protein
MSYCLADNRDKIFKIDRNPCLANFDIYSVGFRLSAVSSVSALRRTGWSVSTKAVGQS